MEALLKKTGLKTISLAAGESGRLTRSELLSALSCALDLTEGLPSGHSQRACWIGMQLADTIHVPDSQREDLFYAILLKDIGCSSNASRLFNLYGSDDIALKSDFRRVEFDKLLQIFRFILAHTRPDAPLRARLARAVYLGIHSSSLAKDVIEDRCYRGAAILEKMGFPQPVSDAVRSLDEHWDGRGLPQRLSGKEIPLSSRIALMAQVIDIFHSVGGPVQATQEVCERSGTWFDPNLVRAFVSVSAVEGFWTSLSTGRAAAETCRFEAARSAGPVHDAEIDRLVEAFSEVIDAKSSRTAGHSQRVAQIADTLAKTLALPANQRHWIRRAALLHDIGKLGLSNTILDHHGTLSEMEQRRYREHVEIGRRILSGIRSFAPILPIIEAHHERFDGTGFPNALRDDQIPLGARVLAIADQFDWLLSGPGAAPNPHQAMVQISSQRGTALDPRCVDALAKSVIAGDIHAPLPL